MKASAFFVGLLLLYSSCASLLNGDYVTVDIHTPEPTEIVVSEDTFYTEDNLLLLGLRRQRATQVLKVKSDTLYKEIRLRSRISSAFYGSILGVMFGAPLVESKTNRMYTFPKSIYVDAKDTLYNFQWYNLPRKGEWYFYAGLPLVNHILYYFDREDIYLHRAGQFGYSLGLEYYYQDDRYFSLSTSRINAYQNYGNPENLNYGEFSLRTNHISLAHHHRWNRFSLGYGFIYQNRQLYLEDIPDFSLINAPPIAEGNHQHDVAGLIFPAHIQLNQQLYIGFHFMPSLYLSPTAPRIKYQQAFSAEIAWKPRLFRSRW